MLLNTKYEVTEFVLKRYEDNSVFCIEASIGDDVTNRQVGGQWIVTKETRLIHKEASTGVGDDAGKYGFGDSPNSKDKSTI